MKMLVSLDQIVMALKGEVIPGLLTLLLGITVLGFSCSANPHVVIQTRLGDIEIELLSKSAPGHTANFLKLVEQEYYAGTTFHRVIPGYVIQGGDPLSKDDDRGNDGTGGPGYTLAAEIKMPHKYGSVAAARMGDHVNPERRSSGSQFFICLNDLPSLDQGGYTVFGQVVQGMQIAEKITALSRDERDNPRQAVVMEKVYLK
jgi:cyclophilin family peptidyl-prolyl cis-trans isomerase